MSHSAYSLFAHVDRARTVDHTMVRELIQSLKYLHQSIVEQSPAHISPFQLTQLSTAISHLESKREIHPAAFGCYYQLAMAAVDDSPDLNDLFVLLLEASLLPRAFTVRPFKATTPLDARVLDLYLICLNNVDPTQNVPILPPDDESMAQAQRSIDAAIDLMKQNTPHLADEFFAMVHEIVLAGSAKEKDELRFDGMSCYMLWGSLFLNADEVKSSLEMMETLVHESSHSFLFGMCIEETLVNNGDEAIYRSPLRTDLRPMDGIYHATYVSARMHYAISEIINSPALNNAQKVEADALLRNSYRAFMDGYHVVAEHADLTTTGRELMKNAVEYMKISPYANQ